jgi:hypothetical protein
VVFLIADFWLEILTVLFLFQQTIKVMSTYKTPTPKQAQRWANALRSGKYKQITGRLQGSNGYCCLGVGCEVFIPKDKQLRTESLSSIRILIGGLPSASSQPGAPKWLRAVDGDFYNKTDEHLHTLNDEGYSFDEIADLIELVYVHKALD